MAEMASVEINGRVRKYEIGTPYVNIADDVQDEFDRPIMLFSVNGKLNELHKKLKGDCTLIAQAPRVGPYTDAMRENIADALGIDISQVNVKATTEEGLGFTGSGEGMAARAVCLISARSA